MRYSWLALVGVLVGGFLHAQQPQQTPAAPAPDPRLDPLLLQWQNKMQSIETLSAEVVREQEDKVFRSRLIFEGKAKYMKPNLAMLDLHRRDKPNIIEKYICTGTYLYEYNPGNKEIRFHELPPPKAGQVADDNFLSFLFGMKAEEAKRRYDLKLVGDDKWYYYIEVLPRFPADKADFQKAQLALTKTTMLPRLLTFDEPNGNRVKWDIPVLENGVRLDRKEFTSPALPPGWRYVRMPRANEGGGEQQPAPRIVRPKQ
jgi:TIGR03009 family protein